MISAIVNNCVKTSLKISVNSSVNRRLLWGWLNSVSNKVSESRIKEVGTEVAAAEWLIRNGAAVKWTKSGHWERDYNSLPKHNPGSDYVIEEIDATDSSIMSVGFPHLRGLKNVKHFIVKRNHYIDDEALVMLKLVKDSLQHLQIVSCSSVTETGILSLTQLQALRTLKLFDLMGVRDKEECLSRLKSSLTNCEIDWN